MAHFGHASFSLGQVVAIWSPPLQIWHPPNRVENDDASGFGTAPLKKLMRVLFRTVTCFSMMVWEDSSSYFRGSYGVSPSSPKTLSIFVAAPTNSSMSANVLTTHNFRISGLNLARNLLFCSVSCSRPF